MSLDDYQSDMEMCGRCSVCKFIPLEKVNGFQHVNVCPSISKYNFNAYSGGGRLNIVVAMLEGRVGYTDKLLEIVYNCQMCGACDVSCKYAMDMEVLEPINEFRIKCVEDGYTLSTLDKTITRLQKQGTMVPGAKSKRGNWADGLDVKDYTEQKVKIIYHAGCRTCYDKDLGELAKTAVTLLKKAGVDIGIARGEELCCGGRAYEMGYKDDSLRQAKHNMELFQKAGAEILVTGCADCYYTFKVLYDKFQLKGDLKVLHTVEYFDDLIKEGKLKPSKEFNALVTYHDPCHLGRLGEPFIHWKGEKIPGYMRRFDPPKQYRRGTYGIYEPPRDVIKSIPGIKLTEMDRIKEYSWCCGSGGGVKETNPDFAAWTAKERIEEAESTGAEAIVTACPGCNKSLKNAIKETGSKLKVYDVIELLEKSI